MTSFISLSLSLSTVKTTYDILFFLFQKIDNKRDVEWMILEGYFFPLHWESCLHSVSYDSTACFVFWFICLNYVPSRHTMQLTVVAIQLATRGWITWRHPNLLITCGLRVNRLEQERRQDRWFGHRQWTKLTVHRRQPDRYIGGLTHSHQRHLVMDHWTIWSYTCRLWWWAAPCD